MNIPFDKMMNHVRSHPFPLVFATISGAHLYGFPSPDSDFDLRGVHLLPLETIVSLEEGQQTVEKEGIYDGLEIDLVTHDAANTEFYQSEYERLTRELERAYEESKLPELPTCRNAISDLLVRLRLKGVGQPV